MHTIIFLLTLMFLSLTGCKTSSYFRTPNDLTNRDCTIYLIDGTEKKGKLTIQFETRHRTDNVVHLSTGKNLDEKIPVDSIAYYELANEHYYPKKIDLGTYEIPNKDNLYLRDVRNILFVKRLTKENSRMILYELFESRVNSSDGVDHRSYFISFHTDDRFTTLSIGSSKFFPKFEEKMSDLVSDCPSLSDKIKEKAKATMQANFL